MDDLISRQVAIDEMPTIDHIADPSKKASFSWPHENGKDAIYRQDAKDRLTILVNEIESIFADIRERNVDDSVCGLCEYDCDHGIDGSAFECLGFERDDCFKLKDEYRKEWTDVSTLPSAQPNVQDSVKDADCISRQDAIDTAVTIARRMLLDTKPIDVKMSSDYLVENLFKPMRKLPSAHPETHEERAKTHACENTCEIERKSNDMISRQAAIDALFELYEYQRDIDPTEAADLVRQGIYLAKKKIEQLPSAEPEQKTGYWEYCRDMDGWHSWLECSKCGRQVSDRDANYCPYCGSKNR